MTSNAKSNVAEQFLALEEGTTPSQLATSLSNLVAGSSDSAGLEHLVWNALIHYVPIAYKNSNGMHGERPPHCETLLNGLGFLLFNGDPKQGLDELKANSTPQQMCGRVFRNGESTYICLDCGVDMTCVLCTQCFHNSEHKKHRYRMAASGGSGCCDCGDEEAWKSAPHCSLHPVAGDDVKTQPALDPELQTRATAILGQCLRYCVQTLTWKDDTTPEWCGLDKYCILLYNDEVHTFDEIIKLLTHSTTLGVTPDTAANLATIIDRDGRLPVASKSLAYCEKMKSNLLAIKLQGDKPQLHGDKPNVILKVFPHDLVLHQVFAISLLGWLENLSVTCGALQKILRDTMLRGSLFQSHSASPSMCQNSPLIIDQVLSVGNVLWKVSRCEFQSFVMSLMTSDTTQKVDFAVKFLQHYDLIQEQFLEDDHEHTMSMASLSVQFFTVPTVAYALLDHHDAFVKIMHFVLRSLDNVKDAEGLLNLVENSAVLDMQRFFYVIEDTRYLLCHPPLEWNDDRRSWFMRGFVCLAKIFFNMEGMEPFKRKENDHVLYEKEWEEGFSLVLHFNNTVRRLLKWIRSDEELLRQCLQHVMDRICARPDNRRFLEAVIKCRVDKPLHQSIVGGDIRKLHVSVHWPLRRFLARIITSAQQNVDIVGLFHKAMEDYYPTERVPDALRDYQAAIMAQCVLEQPLRTFIASQQVAGGMWRRNGHSLYGLMVHYDSVSYSMHDADLALFQVCACVLEPQVFIHTLLARLGAVFTPDVHPDQSLLQLPVEGLSLPNVETFFTVLLNIFGERYDNNVGCGVTDRSRVERELTHALFLGPLTHSEALKEGMSMPSLFSSDSGEKDHRMVDEVLKTVATKQNSRTQTPEYRLKEDYYASCTPFYYHYSKQRQSRAHMRGRQLKDWVGMPVLPALSEMLAPLMRLATSPMLILYLGNRLMCASNLKSKDWNEQTLHQMIYLIGLICQEEDLYIKEVDGRTKAQLTWSFMTPLFNTIVFPGSTLYTLLMKLQDSDRSKECKALLQHVIELLSAHKTRFLPITSESEVANDETDGQALVDVSSPKKDTADEEKARRKKRAAEQRAKALERMQQLQKTFLATEMAGESTVEREESTGGEHTAAGTNSDPAEAAGAAAGRAASLKKLTCILCQEEEVVTAGASVMVMPGYSCISRIVGVDQIMNENTLKDFDAILCPSNLPLGVHMNSCGHAMHASCHSDWLSTETQRRRLSSFGAFHCPMCNSICNLAMPIFPRRTFAPPTCSSFTMAHSLTSVATLFSLALARQAPGTAEMMACEDPPSPDQAGPPARVGSAEAGNPLSRVFRFIAERRRATRRSQSQSDASDGAAGRVVDAMDVMREFASKLCKRLGPDNRLTDRVDIVGASLAYDIMCLEHQLRSEARSVFGELSTRMNDPYDAMTTLVYEIRGAFDSMERVSYSDLRLISAVVGLLPLDSVPLDQLVWIDTDVFHLEPFHLMVQLSLCLPGLADSLKGSHDAAECLTAAELQIWGLNQADYSVMALHVALAVQVMQILIVATPERILESVVAESEEELPSKCLLNLWQELVSRNLVKHWQRVEAIDNMTEQHLVTYVQEQLVPFLSRAALFLRFQGHPLPEVSGVTESYASLAKYLRLPETISEVLAEQLSADKTLLARWINKVESADSTYGSYAVDNRPAKVARMCSSSIFIPSARGMCQLPREYSDFIQRISTLECPQAIHDSTLNKLVKHPAMCMVCGEFLCAMTYCCRKDPTCGNLSYHARMCSGEVGVFLLVWDCKIMILAPPQGMLNSIPYLDEYGESASASGGRTINPLFLDESLFAELQSTWMRHGFIEKVWAASESGHQYMPAHWHDM